MTITSATNRVSFAGDGSTTVFSFAFPITVGSDLKVALRDASGNETLQVIATNYTVSAAPYTSGGAVTMLVAPAAGVTLFIIGNLPVTQPLNLQDGGPLPAGSANGAWDRAVMLIRQLTEKVSRALVLRDTDTMGSGKMDAGGNEITGIAYGTTATSAAAVGQIGTNLPIASTPQAIAGLSDVVVMSPAKTLAEIDQFRPILDATTAGPTADGQVAVTRKGGKTASQIYSPIVPAGYYFWDVQRSVLDLESGTTVQNANAYGAYIYNNIASGASPNAKNAVGLFVDAVNGIAGASTWGINTSGGDSRDNTAPNSVASTIVGYEADFTVYNAGTTVEGLSFILQGGAQPANANAVQVAISSGSTAKWKYGFITNDGAVITAAIQIGATAVSGTSIPSQISYYSYFNSGGTERQIKMQANNAAMNFTSTEFNDGFFFQTGTGNINIGAFGASTDVNLNLYPKGAGTIIAQGALSSASSIAATTSLSGASVSSTGAVLSSGATSGVGYATGAGGAITQITSRTTGVTVNKAAGAITLFSAAGSATPATFTVTNSAVAATDVVIVSQKSGTDKYELFVTAVAAGSFAITFFTTGGTTTEQPVFNFAVIKAVAA